MGEVFIFAGTTEGRELINFMGENNIKGSGFVATEYGESIVEASECVNVCTGRVSEKEMEALFLKNKPKLVIDATHPFATDVTKNLQITCEKTNVEYLRVLREEINFENFKNLIYVESIEEAVNFINENEGNVLVTTGSKNALDYTKVNNFQERVFLRILPMAENLQNCLNNGFAPKNIMCVQGPFTKKANEVAIEYSNAKFLITKETGTSGGFLEKLQACESCGTKAIVIGKPKEKGYLLNEVKEILKKKFNIKPRKKIYVIGGSMGVLNSLTVESKNAISKADVVITTKRIYDGIGIKNNIFVNEYKSENIAKYINESEKETFAVIFSGDIGFFSGAKALREMEVLGNVEYLSGISSFVYFLNKIGKSYEEIKTISVHGRKGNFISCVNKHKLLLVLLGGETGGKEAINKLIEYGHENTKVYIGEQLGSTEEKISCGKAIDLKDKEFHKLSLMVVENNETICESFTIEDSQFIRDKVPMTKSEVRSLSVSKLQLKEDSIVYDVGAGTGSVSIEMAQVAYKGEVFAVERNQLGIELIERNKRKLRVDNVQAIEGVAPDMLYNLEAPTHAFIGGSSGNLKEILDLIFSKNNKARIVVNAITIETLALTTEYLKENNIENYEIINVSVSRNRKLGSFNLMEAQNPIYIISFSGNGGD